MLLRSHPVPAPRRVLSPVAFALAAVLVASLIPALPRQPGALHSAISGDTGEIKQASASTPTAARSMQPALTNLPLTFQQGTGSAAFTAHTAGGTLYFHTDGVTLALAVQGTTSAGIKAHAEPASVPVRLRFAGANLGVAVAGDGRLPGTANYLLGNDLAKWRTGLATYSQIVYRDLYPGITLSYEGQGANLKGTYTLAPGANPSAIRWRYEDAALPLVDASGNLLVSPNAAKSASIKEQAPVGWQEVRGGRVPVSASYRVAQDGTVGVALGAYDASLPLTIDPTLVYSTYLGGSDRDWAQSVAVDARGSAYVVGYTASDDFPTVVPFQEQFAGSWDAFVLKISPEGSTLEYATYLGGSVDEQGLGIAVDSQGNAYVTGYTSSPDFPVKNAMQKAFKGQSDAFVTRLNSTGSDLVYSTYFGGSREEIPGGISLDPQGAAYVAGVTNATDMPTFGGPYQASNRGGDDAWVLKLTPSGGRGYATYLGGNDDDWASGIAAGPDGSAFVTGYTASTNFPTRNPVQATRKGKDDVFVARLDPSGSRLVYSTYLGGRDYDNGEGIAVDGAGNAYITGVTNSLDFPVVNALQKQFRNGDAFVSKLDPTGSKLLYSTFLGGSEPDYGLSIALDSASNAYVAGHTFSSNFPVQGAIQAQNAGDADAYVSEIDPTGSRLVFSTYLGGAGKDLEAKVAVDSAGNIYLAGYTQGEDFPTENPIQSDNMGLQDAYVVKISAGNSGPAQPVPLGTIPGTATRTFSETGQTVQGVFLDYWQTHGGLAQQGYPISPLGVDISELDGKPYTVQYFERAVFEYHPENKPPYDVLLSQLGTFQYNRKYPNGAPGQKASTAPGAVLFKETGHTVGGVFLQYWQAHGGLAQQGYPISEEFQEKSDLNGQTYLVQYFERAVFEYHPENQPPYDVLLSQLGTFRYNDKYPGGLSESSVPVSPDSASHVRLLQTHNAGMPVQAAAYVQAGVQAAGAQMSTVRSLLVAPGKGPIVVSDLAGLKGAASHVVLTPDGDYLAAVDEGGNVRVWDVNHNEQKPTYGFGLGDGPQAIAISRDASTLAVSKTGGKIELWDVARGKVAGTIDNLPDEAISLAISLDGNTLAAGLADASTQLYSLPDGTLLRSLTKQGRGVNLVAFSPDGETLATSSTERQVTLWRVSDGTELHVLGSESPGRPLSLAFSPDGQVLAVGTGMFDTAIFLWSTSDGKLLQTLHGHSDAVTALAFSPDGATLVSGSADKTIRLWGVK